MSRIIPALGLALCAFMLSGCLLVAAGAVGVGASVGDDSAQIVLDQSESALYARTLAVFEKQGKILEQNKETMVIKADIEGSEVFGRVSETSDGKAKVIVSARKWTTNFTDQELALHLVELIDK